MPTINCSTPNLTDKAKTDGMTGHQIMLRSGDRSYHSSFVGRIPLDNFRYL
jgi:hypothetical protein